MGILSMCINNRLWKRVEKTGSPLTAWEAMGTNLNGISCVSTFFYCKGGQTLEKVAQRGCWGSILGDLQSVTGVSPWQPATADPALSRAIGSCVDFQSCLPTSPVSHSLPKCSLYISVSSLSRKKKITNDKMGSCKCRVGVLILQEAY